MSRYKSVGVRNIYEYIKQICSSEQTLNEYLRTHDRNDTIMYMSIIKYCMKNELWDYTYLLIKSDHLIYSWVDQWCNFQRMPIKVVRGLILTAITHKSAKIVNAYLLHCGIMSDLKPHMSILREIYNANMIDTEHWIYDTVQQYSIERLWSHLFWSIILRIRLKEFRERYYAPCGPGYLFAKEKFEKKIAILQRIQK